MALLPLSLVGFAAALVIALLVGLAVTAVVRGPKGSASPEQQIVARSTGRWRLAGAAVGLPVAWFAADQGVLRRGPLLAAPLFGLGLSGGVVMGELRVRPLQGPERSATLDVRRMRIGAPHCPGADRHPAPGEPHLGGP